MQHLCYTKEKRSNTVASDYEILDIIPRLRTEIMHRGKKSWFTVIDTNENRFMCFNRFLHEGIKIGEKIGIRYIKATSKSPSIIVSVLGFDYPAKETKPPKNKAESELFDLMKKEGWELTKKGWPDFACFRADEFILVEVKPKRSHALKQWQRRLMLELSKRDVLCYRWSPDGGFELISPPTKTL